MWFIKHFFQGWFTHLKGFCFNFNAIPIECTKLSPIVCHLNRKWFPLLMQYGIIPLPYSFILNKTFQFFEPRQFWNYFLFLQINILFVLWLALSRNCTWVVFWNELWNNSQKYKSGWLVAQGKFRSLNTEMKNLKLQQKYFYKDHEAAVARKEKNY